MFATWDPQTSIPHRILLSGIDVPRSMADASVAASFAQDFVARHIDLLAPGSSPSDFVLVSNESSAGIRSVGFVQHHGGLEVLGGQISLRFKHDRLVMIGSEAFPNVAVPTRARTATEAQTRAHARDWIVRDVPGRVNAGGGVEGPFVLPMVDAAGGIEFREVFRTAARVEAPATAWEVYVDAGTAEVLARRQTLMFGTGQVAFNVPARNPQSPRVIAPARNVFVTAGGIATATTPSGFVDFPGASTPVDIAVIGPDAAVNNDDGFNATITLGLDDGGTAIWLDESEIVDAQLTAYVHAKIVKDYVRTLATDPWLDEQLPINVNIADTCNAFSDGNSINFYASGGGCENTALLSDVVYHEFGHSIHSQSVIPGVGQFNIALSEGISDYLACTLTEDTGLGRGFYMSDAPLRDFDPEGFEYRWPEDRGEVHDEGRIIGGALWDLRKIMIGKLGTDAGIAYTDRVWYETTRRAVDIPSMYPEALLLDDDDGNLTNGTPNACEINAAYGPHGLFNAGQGNENVSLEATPAGHRVELTLALPNFPDCPVTASPQMVWRPRGTTSDAVLEMIQDSSGRYSAVIPNQGDGTVVEYKVLVNYSNGTERSLPDNIVDPWYQTFFGETVVLQCFDSNAGYGTSGGPWRVGAWSDDDGATDPNTAFGSGDHIYQPGVYPPGSNTRITFDSVATAPYTDIRLHMRRWLSVEDGFFDQASISVNDAEVWSNFQADEDFLASFHHVDREWRFVDHDLSEFAGDGGVEVSFDLRSDGGLEFGGWAVAEACIVALNDSIATCGDGIVDAPLEGCDDGNTDPGDGCDASCRPEPDEPGTGTQGPDDDDDDVETDEGSGGFGTDSETESDTEFDPASLDAGLVERGCVCTSDGGGSGAPGAVMLLGVLAAVRRRRR